MATITPREVKGHVYSYQVEGKRVDGEITTRETTRLGAG